MLAEKVRRQIQILTFHHLKMSRRGRYKRFAPNYEPEPWYTDGSDTSSGNEVDANANIENDHSSITASEVQSRHDSSENDGQQLHDEDDVDHGDIVLPGNVPLDNGNEKKEYKLLHMDNLTFFLFKF